MDDGVDPPGDHVGLERGQWQGGAGRTLQPSGLGQALAMVQNRRAVCSAS